MNRPNWMTNAVARELARRGVTPLDVRPDGFYDVGVVALANAYLTELDEETTTLTALRTLVADLKPAEAQAATPLAALHLAREYQTKWEVRDRRDREITGLIGTWRRGWFTDRHPAVQPSVLDSVATATPWPDPDGTARVKRWLWDAWHADDVAPGAERPVPFRPPTETQIRNLAAELAVTLDMLTGEQVRTLTAWTLEHRDALWTPDPGAPTAEPVAVPEGEDVTVTAAHVTPGCVAAFVTGVTEAPDTATTHYDDDDEAGSYDLGRELGHRLTRRTVEPH